MMTDGQDFSGLIRALASETLRFEAADALISLGGKAVGPLLAALTLENWKIRGNAAWILGKIGDARAVDSLIDALNDDVAEVRGTAGRALIDIGEPSLKPLQSRMERGGLKSQSLAWCVLSCLSMDDDAVPGKRRPVLKTA